MMDSATTRQPTSRPLGEPRVRAEPGGQRRPIAHSVLNLIGDTPTIPCPGQPGLYLKLEGFNPTGSIADRLLLDATVEGAEIHVVGSGQVCAAAALLGAVLGLGVTYH